jgi:hypothetical protein
MFVNSHLLRPESDTRVSNGSFHFVAASNAQYLRQSAAWVSLSVRRQTNGARSSIISVQLEQDTGLCDIFLPTLRWRLGQNFA